MYEFNDIEISINILFKEYKNRFVFNNYNKHV